MWEFLIYLCGIIYAGYFTGTTFTKLIKKAIFNYEFQQYSHMIFNIILIPLLPLMFLGIVMILGIGLEFYYVITTGQL